MDSAMTRDRSISDVVRDILRNVQESLGSEVRLARAEMTQAASFGCGYALGTIMPIWAATFIVAIEMVVAANVPLYGPVLALSV